MRLWSGLIDSIQFICVVQMLSAVSMELDGRRIDAKEAIPDAMPRSGAGRGAGRGAPPVSRSDDYRSGDRSERDRRTAFDEDIKTSKVFVGLVVYSLLPPSLLPHILPQSLPSSYSLLVCLVASLLGSVNWRLK